MNRVTITGLHTNLKPMQVGSDNLGPVKLENALISGDGPGTACIDYAGSGALYADAVWTWDCDDATGADPLLLSPETGDVHLTPGSPAIDTGVADDDYCLEPQPNGGQINPGYWGNTSVATPGQGASNGACGP